MRLGQRISVSVGFHMRRTLRSRSVIAMSIALAGLSVPAPAGADLLDTYQRLGGRKLTRAPLVPTAVPPALAPIERTIGTGTTRGGRGYSIRIVHDGPNGPDAIIVVNGGEFRSMRALLRDHRRLGFRPAPTRIRGLRGYLLTRRLGPVTRTLVWVEGGVVYSVSSGTPRKISLAQLRSTARALDRLDRAWIGASSDPDNSSEAFAVTTARTVSVNVSFEANCVAPGSSAGTLRVGQAGVTLMRRQGNGFAFDIADNRRGSDPWAGTVTGTISPTAITLQVRATGTIEGYACDSGPLVLTLAHQGAGA
jgi:hypothetical protein